jgi:hypothetical protein
MPGGRAEATPAPGGGKLLPYDLLRLRLPKSVVGAELASARAPAAG